VNCKAPGGQITRIAAAEGLTTKTVGSRTYEIRIEEGGDEPRVLCVAALGDTPHVLHAFQKTSRKTPERHLDIGRRRYEIAKEHAGE
jgi:phage-related protein